MMDIDHVPPERAFPRQRRGAVRELLTEEVKRTTRGPWWRRSRRTVTIGASTFALVVAGGAATATYVAFQPATDVHSVWCYAGASLDSPRARVVANNQAVVPSGQRVEDAVPTKPVSVDVNDPIGLCSAPWRDGVFMVGAPGIHEPAPGRTHQVPQLTACTLSDGVAGVFPGDENTCTKLSLPRLAP